MLVIEGPDRVGKSTLITAIVAEAYKLHSKKKLAQTHFGPEIAGYAPVQLLDFMQTMTVFDRFHLSDIAYGMAIRGGSPLTDRLRCDMVTNAIRGHGGMVVLVCPVREEYERMLETRWSEDEMYDKDQLKRVHLHYAQMTTYLERYGVDYKITPTLNLHPTTHARAIAKAYLSRQRDLGAIE